MQEHPDVDWGRLTAYFTGQQTADERAAFERWIAEDSARAEWVAAQQKAWDAIGPVPKRPLDITALKSAVLSRIRSEGEGSIHPTQPRRSRDVAESETGGRVMPPLARWNVTRARGRVRAWTVALVGVSVAVALIAFWGYSGRGAATAPARQYATIVGERTSLTLADGSQVMLGPSTTLSIPANFGSRSRAVTVRGAAYFFVAHANTPFVVSTGETRIRVLGTTFGVRHYERDADVTVAVQTGRVSVNASRGAHFLPLVAAANELAVISTTTATVHRSAADVDRATAWTRGRLEFDDTPLREVIPELERWYDVSFQLADSTVGDVRLSGGFQGQGIDDLAEALRFVLPLSVQRTGRVITIRPR